MREEQKTYNITEEVWKDITGYEGYYQISNFGSVKSVTRCIKHRRKGTTIIHERILRAHKSGLIGNQYLRVNLSKDSIAKLFFVHKLVAIHFVPNSKNLPIANHKDKNPFNNYFENLEWVTTRENVSHGSGSIYTKHKGTYWNKRDKVWRSAIWLNNKLVHLGEFSNEEQAHKAYQEKLASLQINNRYAI